MTVTRPGALLRALVGAALLAAGCAPGPQSESAPAANDVPAATDAPASAAGQSAVPDATQSDATLSDATLSDATLSDATLSDATQPDATTSPARSTAEAPADSAARPAAGSVDADAPRGFEPPGEGPAPATTAPVGTLPAPSTSEKASAEQTPAAQTPAEHDLSEAPVGASVLPPVGDGVARWSVEIIEWIPHDPGAFTQGLEVADGIMYESTGLWGESTLRALNPATGEVTARVDLPDQFFGEGLTVAGDEIVQLTWRSGTARVYDRATLDPLWEHRYEGEGWGLCEMGGELIMTDGSDRLARRDLDTFELLGTVTATASGYDGRLDNLNELECVESMVIANVWQTDHLLVIDPDSGQVVATIDAGPLVDDASQASAGSRIDVLNGVAVDEKTATLWMTGKLWPRLYRVRVVEVS